ncbi:hypothetical protein EV363DRAFT_744208 [Boletus edulis]|nr:hypothetical protein EV363DRAFT_744208 [Boletus edulis]
MNEAQSPRQSSLSATPDSRSRTVDATSPSSKSGTLRALGSPTGATNETHNIPNSVPSSTPPIVASLSSAIADDPGNLSDLTDLTTDVDSPIRSSIIAIPVPETPQRPSMQLSRSPQSGSGTSPDTQAQLKSRLVFDCVEIPQPEWYSGAREKKSSREKRKRIIGPFPSDIVGSPDFDNPSSAAHEMSNRSLSKRKRKMSPGPASR